MENFLVLNSHGLRDEMMYIHGGATIDLEHEKNNCYVFFTKRGITLDNNFAKILNTIFYYNEDNINTELHQMCETLKKEYQRILSFKSPSRILEPDFSIKYSFRKDNIRPLENKMLLKIAEIFTDLIKITFTGPSEEIEEKYKTKPLYLNIIFPFIYPIKSYDASDVEKLFNFQLRFYFHKLPNTYLDFKLFYGKLVNKSGLYELSDYFKDNITETPLNNDEQKNIFVDRDLENNIMIRGESNDAIIDYLYDKMFKNSIYLSKDEFIFNIIGDIFDTGSEKFLILDNSYFQNTLDVLIKEEDVFTLQNRNYLMLICNSIDLVQIDGLPEFDEMLKVERQKSEGNQGLLFKGREGFNVPNAYYYKKYLKYKNKYLKLKNK
tara:strand:+ start:88 stop:1224 length:1137 start_codon:yes stop_codon:yes gene_type:complete